MVTGPVEKTTLGDIEELAALKEKLSGKLIDPSLRYNKRRYLIQVSPFSMLFLLRLFKKSILP